MSVDPKVYHLAAHWLDGQEPEKNIKSLAETIQQAIEDWHLHHGIAFPILLIVPYILLG